ncbi:hypothetical protein [Flaviflexus huanghaiensis]|uniref:pyroglutamyl-peptidase I family protein n=1 Tax=Flaviflexus huanghaiensis TaxID=1111473 RepID=UPI0015FBB326|nr:hypothetical protein [Flaviflexus huanghaiensis]
MIVLTGFGPFGPPETVAHDENPSETLALAAGRAIGAHVEILPVSYAAVANVGALLADAELVLSLGVAGSRQAPMLEKHAVNWRESRIPDIDGKHARGELIDVAGPDTVRTGWDVDAVASGAGLGVSLSAGAYVCNALSYSLYRHHRNACFLHIPPSEHMGLDEGIDLIGRIITCSMSV